MVISHSYVSLPEGKGIHITIYQPLQKNGPPALPAFEDVQWHGAGGNGVRKATRSPGGVPEPGKISNSRSYIFFNHFKSFNEHFLIFFWCLGGLGGKFTTFLHGDLGELPQPATRRTKADMPILVSVIFGRYIADKYQNYMYIQIIYYINYFD